MVILYKVMVIFLLKLFLLVAHLGKNNRNVLKCGKQLLIKLHNTHNLTSDLNRTVF